MADFNLDGFLDVIISTSYATGGAGGRFSVWLGNGDGTFDGPYRYVGSASAAGDFNGDGTPDVVGPSANFNDVEVVLNCTVALVEPHLTIEGKGDEFIISWRILTESLNIESTTNLTTPSWSRELQTPKRVGGRYQISIKAGDAQRYFRLIGSQ